VCCSVLQCVSVCCSVALEDVHKRRYCIVVICLHSAVAAGLLLQCNAVCCSVRQCVAVYSSVLQFVAVLH